MLDLILFNQLLSSIQQVVGDLKRIYPPSEGLTRDRVRQGSQWMTLTRQFCEFLISGMYRCMQIRSYITNIWLLQWCVVVCPDLWTFIEVNLARAELTNCKIEIQSQYIDTNPYHLLDPLARDYLVAFGTTYVPDESFIPTLLYTTNWNRTLFHSETATPEEKKQALMRHIVWSPGQWHPDVLKSKDLPKIFASNGLFARKFDPWASRVYEDIDSVIDSTVPEHSRYQGFNSTIIIKKPDIDEENSNNNGEDNNGVHNNNNHGDEYDDVDVAYCKGNARSRRQVHLGGRSE